MIKQDCRFYKGHKPCNFNKLDGSECSTCEHYSPFRTRVLVIKLDALGDVLRTGSLLPTIKARHESPYICWITRPEAVELVSMMPSVDDVIRLDVDGLARLSAGSWDYVYALSNDMPTASLATMSRAKRGVFGYTISDGRLHPGNEAARHWMELAAFDRLKKANTTSYQRLMLDIIGEPAAIHAPRLMVPPHVQEIVNEKIAGLFGNRLAKRVAINIGSGARWPKKMLDHRQIAHFAKLANVKLGLDVLLVGGNAETQKANAILELCGGDSKVRSIITGGSIQEFVACLSTVDVLMCGDTLALHVATAIDLPTVCVVGPTSQAELWDYGGLIRKVVTEELDCLCCYGDCDKIENCMSLLDIEQLIHLTADQLSRGRSN